MPLTLDENSAIYQVRGYKAGCIQINQEYYYKSLIIDPNQLILDWFPQKLSELKFNHFDAVIKHRPSILLIGTGDKLEFPAIEVYGDLINQGIGVEIMNTHAACRTYNALSAEGRDVMAALILS
jgi:uncharacterized protein